MLPLSTKPTQVKSCQRCGLSKEREGDINPPSGYAGAGFVVRDCAGAVLLAGSVPLIVAEERGLWEGIRAAIGLGFRRKIWVEGDSLATVSMLSTNEIDDPIVLDCKRMLLCNGDFRASHVRRNGNSVADWLAALSKTSRQPFWCGSVLPPSPFALVCADCDMGAVNSLSI